MISECKECLLAGDDFGAMLMLPRELWLEICDDKRDVLCANCICKRLGSSVVLFAKRLNDVVSNTSTELVITTKVYKRINQ